MTPTTRRPEDAIRNAIYFTQALRSNASVQFFPATNPQVITHPATISQVTSIADPGTAGATWVVEIAAAAIDDAKCHIGSLHTMLYFTRLITVRA
jgi:hypothetical protein